MINAPNDRERFEEVGVDLKRAADASKEDASAEDHEQRVLQDEAIDVRRQLLQPAVRLDPVAYERVLGTRDLMGISYLSKGLEAARAVCRIDIRSETSEKLGYGTGFLVAPGILMTNNHVLDRQVIADRSFAEFGFELDHNLVESQPKIFQLLPDVLFLTDPRLDFTVVAVARHAQDGSPLSEFAYLPLIPASGKAVSGEAVSIIQHPLGEHKQIVVRENRVIRLDSEGAQARVVDFVHYTADTERGSSGSPVFNDQWQVVALHHMSIADRDAQGRVLAKDGSVWDARMGDEQKAWIANEGVRISKIFHSLARSASTDPRARAALSRLLEASRSELAALRNRAGVPLGGNDTGEDAPPFEADRFIGAQGYDADFLVFPVPLPTFRAHLKGDVTPFSDSSGESELRYHNFSVFMSITRRLALYSAVNIDGTKLKKTSDDASWRTDSRIERDFQSDNRLYKFNPLDRGHLVRRLDPVWGDDAEEALADTFHYTNAAPQEHGFNDGVWGELEDYILDRARDTDHKVTVFSGPIFSVTDGFYGSDRDGGPYQLPAEYWKVVVFSNDDDTPSVSAYRLTQAGAIHSLLERMSEEEAHTVRVNIREIEDVTGLDFGSLRDHDNFIPDDSEATRIGGHLIRGPEDLLL